MASRPKFHIRRVWEFCRSLARRRDSPQIRSDEVEERKHDNSLVCGQPGRFVRVIARCASRTHELGERQSVVLLDEPSSSWVPEGHGFQAARGSSSRVRTIEKITTSLRRSSPEAQFLSQPVAASLTFRASKRMCSSRIEYMTCDTSLCYGDKQLFGKGVPNRIPEDEHARVPRLVSFSGETNTCICVQSQGRLMAWKNVHLADPHHHRPLHG